MTKKRPGSYRYVKRFDASVLFNTPITDAQRRRMKRMAGMPDSEIDLSDAPVVIPKPSDIIVGGFYRPIKKLVSLRVDADVLAWYRSRGKKYQTFMNEVLRREMNAPRGLGNSDGVRGGRKAGL